MNISYFLFWNKIKPVLLETWSFMMTRSKQKIGWLNRFRQAFLWGAIFMLLAFPLGPFCKFLAELSSFPIVMFFWALIGFIVTALGALGGLVSLITLPTLIAHGIWVQINKKP